MLAIGSLCPAGRGAATSGREFPMAYDGIDQPKKVDLAQQK